MSSFPNIEYTHPAGMVRVNLGCIWMNEADHDYVTGALVERNVKWEDFAKDALIEAASR